jgi:hypothetical protein
MNMEHWWNDTDRGKLRGRKICPNAFLQTIIPHKERRRVPSATTDFSVTPRCKNVEAGQTDRQTDCQRKKQMVNAIDRVLGKLRSVPFSKYCLGDQIEKYEIGGACSAYGGQER